VTTRVRDWAERILKPAEDGSNPVRQIQLTCEATTWQTWDAPFELERIATEAETMLEQLKEELPVRRVPATFVATDATGGVRATHLESVQGKNKQAGELSMGATGQASKSFAEAMETMVRVVNVVLKSAEIQVSSLTKTCESQATQLHEMHEYNRARAEHELLNAKEDKPDAMAAVGEQVKEALPVLMAVVSNHFAEKAQNTATNLAKATASAAVATPTNGVS
jgi:hypothetical protein